MIDLAFQTSNVLPSSTDVLANSKRLLTRAEFLEVCFVPCLLVVSCCKYTASLLTTCNTWFVRVCVCVCVCVPVCLRACVLVSRPSYG